MTGRQKIIVAIAAAHLLLVAWHSATLPLSWSNPIGDGLRWYGAVSGANNSYGFFKQVGCGVRPTFTILLKNGSVIQDKLHQEENREVSLRISSGVNLLDDTHTEYLMQNWAAEMFGRYPEATLVRVNIEIYDPGTMEDYRAGKRPQWEDRTKDTPKIYVRHEVVGG